MKNEDNDSNGADKVELIGSYDRQAIKHSCAGETERIVRRREHKEDKEISDRMGVRWCALSPGAKNVPEWLKTGEGRSLGAKSANFPAALWSIVNCG